MVHDHFLGPCWQDNVRLNDFTSNIIIIYIDYNLRVLGWLIVISLAQNNSQEKKRRTEESPIRAQLKTPTEIVVVEESDMQALKSI